MTKPTDLTPQQEEFARLYYAGPEELRGNATRCYLEVYYGGHEGVESGQSIYRTASANASHLLHRDKVLARIAEIRDEAAGRAKARARSWWEMYPDAQRTLWAAITGRWGDLDTGPNHVWDDEAKRSAVKAAQEVVERCEGTAKQVHEHRVRGGILVQVAGPSHEDLAAAREEEDPALRSGPRYIEAESTPSGHTGRDGA